MNKVDEVRPVEEDVIVFNSTGKLHKDKNLLTEKRTKVFELITSLRNSLKPEPKSKTYYYRKSVKLDLEQADKDSNSMEELDKDIKRRVSQFNTFVMNRLKRGTLGQYYPFSEIEDLDKYKFKDIKFLRNKVIEEYKTITFTSLSGEELTITEEEYELHSHHMKLSSKGKHLFRVLNELGYWIEDMREEERIPVMWKTIPYIQFEDNKTFVEFSFSTLFSDMETKTNIIINQLITELEKTEGIEVVNLYYMKSYAKLGVLCDNEQLTEVLDSFARSYKRSSYLKAKTYAVEIDATVDIGNEDKETVEFYKVLEGEYFKPVYDMLEPTDETLFGYNVYL
ncbi:hypothetical protein [Bacillus thuringiensis]|uniref:hypothetical protein n=1 Tax=Bacillus thuringiensis TaxID=1428 RepID=UPI00127E75C1|nr:hypothetical protein [Bacillus thuringiensis]KAA8487025.1 hypothetical protein FYW98_15285 [Bacillus thuringiensis]